MGTKFVYENCLKGIPKKEYLLGKSVRWIAFQPPSSCVPENGWYASLVNWEKDEGAIIELFTRKNKDGSQKFKPGLARVPIEEIDRIIDQYELVGKFDYDDENDSDNDYHGNLLFHKTIMKAKGVEKGDKALICSALSRAVTEIITDE